MQTPEENTQKHAAEKSEKTSFEYVSEAGRTSLPSPKIKAKEDSETKDSTPNKNR